MSAKLRNLQALRGVACLLILLYHAADMELTLGLPHERLILRPLLYFGFSGVDLFFVISGFIITWVHYGKLGRPAELGGYVRKRFWRIYPTYWVCAAASALLMYPILRLDLPHPKPNQAVCWLLLLPREGMNLFVHQAWSLVYEVFFYLAFAAFFLLPRRAFLPALAAWFAAVAWLRFVVRPTVGFGANLAFESFILEFLLGCFAAAGLRTCPAGGGVTCVVLGIIWVAAGAWVNSRYFIPLASDTRWRFVLFGVPAALLVYGLTAWEWRRGFALPGWLQSAGDASYSIYLWHVSVFHAVNGVVLRPTAAVGSRLGWLGLLLASGVAVGFFCHRVVEQPLLDWLQGRRAAGDGGPAPATPAEPSRLAA